jgi:natural product biosynthesis luciferase-like monooxygenase protein
MERRQPDVVRGTQLLRLMGGKVRFSLMFFSSSATEIQSDRYELIRKSAVFADENSFEAIWTPERHFHPFGGLFPNPSVLSAGLAMITSRIHLRAGSLIVPLHNALRVTEEWALVDNLSFGRVGISFGAGWNADDFVLAPERYTHRRSEMFAQIDLVRHLWEGGWLDAPNGVGSPAHVRVFPPPVQRSLPTWITSSGNPDTFADAGSRGTNILTHVLGQDLEDLARKIAMYRRARGQAGIEASSGIVTVMLHTYVASDLATAHAIAVAPLREYLRSSVALEQLAAIAGGVVSGGHTIPSESIDPSDMEELLEIAAQRYMHGASLIGSTDSCASFISDLSLVGVDEVACLIDFGIPTDVVLTGLNHLNQLRATTSSSS